MLKTLFTLSESIAAFVATWKMGVGPILQAASLGVNGAIEINVFFSKRCRYH